MDAFLYIVLLGIVFSMLVGAALWILAVIVNIVGAYKERRRRRI
jgi:hypothetical protein